MFANSGGSESRRSCIRDGERRETMTKHSDSDDAEIDLDTQELAGPLSDQPLGYGPGEWASGPFPRSDEKAQQPDEPLDARIHKDVCDRLTAEPSVDAAEIRVAVHEGEVILRGRVLSREIRRRAEDLAFDVTGVRHVNNDLRISG